MRGRRGLTAATAAFALAALAACTDASASGDELVVSGSSTVYPITQAVARDSGFDLDMAAEGTTDGFERFCRGETHVNNASEAIPGAGQPTDYVQMCADNGVEYIELPIALDALSVVRHIDNDFATNLTLDELSQAWAPDSDVTTWSDLRPAWPDEEIEFVGRPAGSGTFEYFTHQVNGEVGAIREDYRGSDDMVELAGWVADDVNSLGFMGGGQLPRGRRGGPERHHHGRRRRRGADPAQRAGGVVRAADPPPVRLRLDGGARRARRRRGVRPALPGQRLRHPAAGVLLPAPGRGL